MKVTKNLSIAFILHVFLGFAPISAFPCSAFLGQKNSDLMFAKSYDWDLSHGYLIVNKRSVRKTALRLLDGDNAMTWTSRFGSLSFNQYGHEFPLGGMNEAGLAVETLWLSSSEYPEDNNKKSFNELQWVQYHLDTAETISEMIRNAREVRISPVVARVHYMACDRTGDCAVFEYIDGELEIHSTTDASLEMPIPTITNSTYRDSLEFIKDYKSFGGKKDIPEGYNSLNRFVRASYITLNGILQSKNLKSHLSAALDSVASNSGYSKWNIIYDFNKNTIHFKTRYSSQKLDINMKDLDFNCNTPVQALQISSHDGWRGESTFSPMTLEKNSNMVFKSFGLRMPLGMLYKVINYPSTLDCQKRSH